MHTTNVANAFVIYFVIERSIGSTVMRIQNFVRATCYS